MSDEVQVTPEWLARLPSLPLSSPLLKWIDNPNSEEGGRVIDWEATRAAVEAEGLLRQSGMVLDLSELPRLGRNDYISFSFEGGEWGCVLRCGVDYVAFGATPAEAYTAALKAWREDG